MKKLISVIFPTRKRVPHLTNLLNAIIETTNDISRIEVLLRVDTDDEQTLSFLTLPNNAQKHTVKYKKVLDLIVIVGDRGNGYIDFNDWYTALAYTSTGEWVWYLNDDITLHPSAKGWDSRIEKIPGDKILIPDVGSYGWPFVPRKFFDVIKGVWIGPFDIWWWDAGQSLGCIQRIDVPQKHQIISDDLTKEKHTSHQIKNSSGHTYFWFTKKDPNGLKKSFIKILKQGLKDGKPPTDLITQHNIKKWVAVK